MPIRYFQAARMSSGTKTPVPVTRTFTSTGTKHEQKPEWSGFRSRIYGDIMELFSPNEDAGRGLFRGVRHSGAHDPNPEALRIMGRAPAGLYADEAFRAGVARLGERGLSFDTWHFHHQNRDFRALAEAVPGTTIVLDHFGTPLGVGAHAGRREDVFAAWLCCDQKRIAGVSA